MNNSAEENKENVLALIESNIRLNLSRFAYPTPSFLLPDKLCPFCKRNNLNDLNIVNFLNPPRGECKPTTVLGVRDCNSCGGKVLYAIKYATSALYTSVAYQGYNMIYPKKEKNIFIQPYNRMPDNVKEFFEEAQRVLTVSSRGAVALLRVATEELINNLLGEEKQKWKSHNLKDKIDFLKKEEKIGENAYDLFNSMRLYGNEASHPGDIIEDFDLYLKDDKNIIKKMFELLNEISKNLILQRDLETVIKSAPIKNKSLNTTNSMPQ